MELDVNITRDGDVPWGFELVGGADCGIPLTIVKVKPSSIAKSAGLQDGDKVLRINNTVVSDLTYNEARKFIIECGDSFNFGVSRGLYDPCLDDQEPLYDYAPDDFDQPSSEPTEVFQIQRFIEPPNLADTDPEFNRSLTASPFVLPTKPYRPFSTEPLPDVPPLEDPIILNPNYRDEFGKLQTSLQGHPEDIVETKFKLPISKLYDPNAIKKQSTDGRVESDTTFTERIGKDARGVHENQTGFNIMEMKDEIIIKDMKITEETKIIEVKVDEAINEIKSEEKVIKDVKIVDTREEMTKEDLEVQKIKETAKFIVEDSIDRAVSVAEEIKNEMNVEIDTSEVKTEVRKQSKELIESETRKESIKMESEEVSATQKVVKMGDKTEEVVKDDRKAEVKVEKDIEQLQTYDQEQGIEQRIEERKQSIRQEIEETIEPGRIRKKAVFTKEESFTKPEVKGSQALEESVASKASAAESNVTTEFREQGSLNQAKMARKESASKMQAPERSQNEVKTSTESASQKVYTIGLQTIPNIRGTVHSSYHYDLLLKTFFIHLTDVMVALSRFILSEPAFSKTEEKHERTSVSQQLVNKTVDVKKEQRVAEAKKDKAKRVDVEKNAVQKEHFEKEMKEKVLEKKEAKSFKNIVKEEIVGKQREQKKMEVAEETMPQKIVQKTTVQSSQEKKQESISDDDKHVEKVEQQIIKEDVKRNMVAQSEIIEKNKLSGAKMSQLTERKSEELTQKMGAVISEFQTKAVDQFAERVETSQRRSRSSSRSRIEEEVMRESDPLNWLEKYDSKKSSVAETKTKFSSQFSESKRFHSTQESKTYKTYKPKPGKQTYVAIVESHVYTNRDAILEDYAAEISETASMESAEEINTALQSMEAVTTENVAFNSTIANKQVAQTMVEKAREFLTASAKREATAQRINERLYEAKETKHEQYEKSYALNKQEAREVIVQALQEVLEPVIEFEQTEETKVHEAVMNVEKSFTLAKEEHVKSIALAKTSEETTEVKETRVLQQQEMKIEKAAMNVEEEYSSAKKDYVQPLAIAKPADLKVEISETDTFESKVTESKTAIVSTIEDFKTAEKAEVKSLAFAKTEELKADIKEAKILENQELHVAKASEAIEEDQAITIEVTEPDVKKAEEVTVDETLKIKRRKPHDEESAELKIVKYEYIEPDGVDVITVNEESELTIKENIEINKSLQSVIGQSDNYVSKQTGLSATELSSHLESRKDVAEVSMEQSIEKSLKEQSSVTYSHEANVTAKPAETQLALRTDLTKALDTQLSIESDENNNSPSPTTVPPTPLTDEYIFKLAIPLPKSRSPTPAPREHSPNKDEDPNIVKKRENPNIVMKHEDPNIVKKKLVPHIETKIESVIYDPPLPTPPEDKPSSPTYTKPGLTGGSVVRRLPFYFKPGLRGGCETPWYRKEEIREIERKSSLLASAIDETIKSIEEYKETVAMEMNKEYKKKEVIKTEHSSTKFEQTISKKTSSESLMNGKDEIIENKTKIKEIKQSNGVEKNGETIIDIKSESDTDGFKENAGNVKNTQNGEATKERHMSITETEFKKVISKEDDPKTSIRVMRMKSLEEKKPNEELANESQNLNEFKTEELVSANNAIIDSIIQSVDADTSDQKIRNETELKKNCEVFEPEVINTSEVHLNDGISKVTDIETLTEVNIKEFKPEVTYTPEALPKKVANEMKFEENINSRMVNESSVKNEIIEAKTDNTEEKPDPLLGFRPVHFDPESIQEKWSQHINYMQEPIQIQGEQKKVYITEGGELIGTVQGIVDGLEEAVVDEEVAKELGKPGMAEEKIAELISGEAEILREAHVMGLARVLSTHMHRADDSSEDFKKIQPIVEILNNSEVLKALNEDLERTQEEKKKEEEKKWTTFLQKPKRPVPRARFGYPGYVEPEIVVNEEPYKVKIVKQPKPKVAPDYKPEDFDTGPLPWEQRAEIEASLPPVEPEEPILIPEEVPEFLEAVDPLPESEIPDLEDTGIPLPKFETITLDEPILQEYDIEYNAEEQKEEELDQRAPLEETEQILEENMEQNTVIDQLLRNVQSLVDPHAPLEQQLIQMRGQLAALAQLPEVIQQTLDLVTRQFSQISQQEAQRIDESQNYEQKVEEAQNYEVQESTQQEIPEVQYNSEPVQEQTTIDELPEPQMNGEVQHIISQEEMEMRRREEEEVMKSEKQKKIMMEQARLESESRQVKQRPTPRVGKPKRMFGPLSPEERAIVLPGGRRWRGPNDAYNEQLINETLTAQSELIQGRVLGPPFESEIHPYDNRINFMKYEKPPVSLDHLQNSEVYKLIHDMDETPRRRVEMRTPVMCEADYRERVRSQTPCLNIPQQLHP